EPAENFAEQIIGAELAGDRRQLDLRTTQLLGEQFEGRHRAGEMRGGGGETFVRGNERVQMPLACEKGPLHVLVRTGNVEDGVLQQVESRAGFRREPDRVSRAVGYAFRKIAREIDLV